MTTDQVLERLGNAGYQVALNGAGEPVLRKDCGPWPPPAEVFKVLRWHRLAIKERLGGNGHTAPVSPPAGTVLEVRWATGLVESWEQSGPGHWPVGATHWRTPGGEWRPIPEPERRATADRAKAAVRAWVTTDGGVVK